MFTTRLRHPLLFVHNQFSSYMNKTTQKFKKEAPHFLTLTSFPPTPSSPNVIFIFLSISLLLNYYLYNKKLICHSK